MAQEHLSLRVKWRRFRMRPAEDRHLILLAAFILALTKVGLSWFGFQRWKELIEKVLLPADRPLPLPAGSQFEKGLRVARAVHSAELHGIGLPNCLERSLTLWLLLRLKGIAGELHIGARKVSGRLDAHAWVELDGRVLNDGAEVYERYALFDAPIAAGSAQPRTAGRTAFE